MTTIYAFLTTPANLAALLVYRLSVVDDGGEWGRRIRYSNRLTYDPAWSRPTIGQPLCDRYARHLTLVYGDYKLHGNLREVARRHLLHRIYRSGHAREFFTDEVVEDLVGRKEIPPRAGITSNDDEGVALEWYLGLYRASVGHSLFPWPSLCATTTPPLDSPVGCSNRELLGTLNVYLPSESALESMNPLLSFVAAVTLHGLAPSTINAFFARQTSILFEDEFACVLIILATNPKAPAIPGVLAAFTRNPQSPLEVNVNAVRDLVYAGTQAQRGDVRYHIVQDMLYANDTGLPNKFRRFFLRTLDALALQEDQRGAIRSAINEVINQRTTTEPAAPVPAALAPVAATAASGATDTGEESTKVLLARARALLNEL
jgi:hypothetical protein